MGSEDVVPTAPAMTTRDNTQAQFIRRQEALFMRIAQIAKQNEEREQTSEPL
jgi:hypothetical protein